MRESKAYGYGMWRTQGSEADCALPKVPSAFIMEVKKRGDGAVTEVVAALIWDKFVICQRLAHKVRGLLWEFTGGKVEQGEKALIRECREKLASPWT